MVSRTPPESVRRILRKEVNFGCPVHGCGVPYLTWHHFDPPWNIEKHHNPEGMIALCHKHADLADGKRWTKDQLRQMKQKPYLSQDEVKERYDYLRKDAVCIVGNIAFHVKNILKIDGERVIWFERDSEGYEGLNILIRDSEGRIILQMEDNDWTAHTDEVFDLICPPQGKELRIISKDKGTDYTIRFDEYSLFDFGNLLSRIGFVSNPIMEFMIRIGCEEYVPVWTRSGNILWGNNHLSVIPGRLTELNFQNSIQGSSMIGVNSAVTFRNGIFR
jgi:hypothetical protein